MPAAYSLVCFKIATLKADTMQTLLGLTVALVGRRRCDCVMWASSAPNGNLTWLLLLAPGKTWAKPKGPSCLAGHAVTLVFLAEIRVSQQHSDRPM